MSVILCFIDKVWKVGFAKEVENGAWLPSELGCASAWFLTLLPVVWSVRGREWGVWSRKCWDIEENVQVFLKKVGEFQEKVGELLEEVGDILANMGDFLRNVGEKTRVELGLMWFAWERWSIAQPSHPMKDVGVATKTLENKNLCVNLCA